MSHFRHDSSYILEESADSINSCNRTLIVIPCLTHAFITPKKASIKKRKIGDMIEIDVNYSESFVKEHIEKWVNAWNNHDLKSVLSMYSDDIEFSSPKVKVVYPERKQSKVTNKRELEEYWTNALKNYPNLHFTPKQIISQGNVCIFEYYAVLDAPNTKTSVIEKFEFRGDGLISKSSGFYGATEEAEEE